jgi:Mce-associated membrane protein
VLAVLTGGLWWWSANYQDTITAREQAMAAARDSVVELLSYNYRTIDRQMTDTQGMITGKFKDDYASLLKNVIVPGAKAQQLAIQTTIADDSVVSSSPGEVVLLMFINQQSEGHANQNPALTASRVQVTLQRLSGNWMISNLVPV